MQNKLLVAEIILAIIAVILCFLWFNNPEGNFEPILVFIGFILTFVDIKRRELSSQKLAAVADEKPIVHAPVEPVVKEKSEQIEKQFPIKNDVVESNQEGDFNLLFEDIVSALSTKEYTKLQIEQFAKRNTGRKINLNVKVESVEPMFKRDNSELILTFTHEKASGTSSMPTFFTATFERKHEKDLAALSSGYNATISGELSFSNLIGDYKASIKNAELISFKKF
ncbi:hypothetical protein [Alteromonas stellipolaris]|uniref:hypothetical protein n=1 Tax=Alteromonas stellipolaris TaxID=233316 RepID=UPI001E05B957|nr:hypothetical protein [Alteromonas stellipolaris]MBZ2164327.1 hypothetical protein [Alteromonas stellipolaris]